MNKTEYMDDMTEDETLPERTGSELEMESPIQEVGVGIRRKDRSRLEITSEEKEESFDYEEEQRLKKKQKGNQGRRTEK